MEGLYMDVDVDVYTAKDGSNFLVTLAYLRPSIQSGIDMSEFEETPQRIRGAKDPAVLEAVLGENRCFCTTTKPTHELLSS